MKKALVSALAAIGLVAAATGAAYAATAGTGTVTVTPTLTSICTATTNVTFAFAYTAFGAAVPLAASNMVLDCTRNLAITAVSFDTSGTIASDTSSGTTGGAVGVVKGLQYTLSSTAPTTVAGTATTTSALGTQDVKTIAVSGNVPASQPGDATGLATQVRTLTLTF